MAHRCTSCGVVYDSDDADYCNHCGSEDLEPVAQPSPASGPPRPLRDDPFGVVAAAVLWTSGVLYVVGPRQPRTWGPLIFIWGALFVMSAIAGLILRNVRAFMFFAAVGGLCLLLYGLIKVG